MFTHWMLKTKIFLRKQAKRNILFQFRTFVIDVLSYNQACSQVMRVLFPKASSEVRRYGDKKQVWQVWPNSSPWAVMTFDVFFDKKRIVTKLVVKFQRNKKPYTLTHLRIIKYIYILLKNCPFSPESLTAIFGYYNNICFVNKIKWDQN